MKTELRQMKNKKQLVQLRYKDVSVLRDKLLKKQKGICPICVLEIHDPCLDHSHRKKLNGTGLIRGVLCRTCNSLIAKIENNCSRFKISQKKLPKILCNISVYLEKDHLPYIHPTEKEKPKKLKKSSYNKLKKQYNGRAKFPKYPVTKKLTKKLEKLFIKCDLEPEFYK